MGTLGTHLRNAREARGIDLREAAQQTRIGYAYLVAIEREDFSKLPGEVFVKGFLRNYAKFLGIPADEVMRLYAELKTPPASSGAPQAAMAQEPPKREHREPEPVHEPVSLREGSGGVERYVWAAVAILFLIAALFVVYPERHAEKKNLDSAQASGTGAESLSTAPASTTGLEKLYLDVTALGELWVLIRTDSSPQKKAVLKKGESVTWSADERFLLSMGNLGAARILLNGKELTINAPGNATVRDIEITAKGVIVPKIGIEQRRPRKPKPVAPPLVPAELPVPPAPAAPAETAVPEEIPVSRPAGTEPSAPATPPAQ